jgi:lipooligosaccharide transport system permease protein
MNVVVSPGRVPGWWGAIVAQTEGQWTWYRKNFLVTGVRGILQPVLYLGAMGLAFGSQVRSGVLPHGLSYAQYLLPALIMADALQTAFADSSYPISSGFKWQKDIIAVTNTPVAPFQVVVGKLTWTSMRLVWMISLYILIAVPFGAVVSPAILWTLPLSILLANAVAAPVMAVAAAIKEEGNAFNFLRRFVLIPMTLFAGTYFPITNLPILLKVFAWISPLWHATELSRAVSFGIGPVWPFLGHLAYLFLWAGVGMYVARQKFIQRLVV